MMWVGCFEWCLLMVKFIVCIGSVIGDADNVWGIEESVAKIDVWRNYKGYFILVSLGEFNMWGLNIVIGIFVWMCNVDFN